jgi:hypothetical protein
MAIRISNRPAALEGHETDYMLARLELIAHAEEQAATAEEQDRIAAELGHETLACAPVLTLAIEQLTRTHADVCQRMAAAAIAEGDVLLARALRSLADKLLAAARDAASAATEANDFGEAVAAELPQPQSAETV